MSDIFAAISGTVTMFIEWLNSMVTTLIENPLVLIMIGLGVALLIFKVAMGLIGRVRGGKRKRR